MSLGTPAFAHEFRPGAVHFGRECIGHVDQAMADRGLENALVVCGRNVGANDALMDPIRAGLGDRLAGVFDQTTPAKHLETVFDGVEYGREVGADVVVAVGGGSSLDVAKAVAAHSAGDRSYEELHAEIVETHDMTLPDEDLLPWFGVPTTMAGADLSVASAVVAATDDGPAEAIAVDTRLMPTALFYDPDLFDTTPMDVLAGSAINGFDKGVEAIYSQFANPIVDSTAVRGLQYLRSSLPELRHTDDPSVMERAVMGIILVQYGVSVPDAYRINVVHAFGHALRNTFGIQQGVAHAVVVPHALRLIFEEGGGRPDVLAEGLLTGEESADTQTEAIVEAVTEIRDGLDLPARLRDVEGTSEEKLRAAAEYTAGDAFFSMGPPEFDPSVDEVEQTLRDAW